MIVTAQAFAAGLARLLLVVVPAIIVAVRARRAILPEADPPLARLAEAILGVSLLVVLAEGLGAFGEFRLAPLALAAVTAAALSPLLHPRGRPGRQRARLRPVADGALPPLAASFVQIGPAAGMRPGPAAPRPAAPRRRLPPLGAVLAVALVLGVLAVPWLASTVSAWSHGFRDYDTEQYHLTEAAYFAQSHTLAHLHYISAGDAVSFYPFNVELLHAIGLLAFHADFMSLLVNPLGITLALLAAACLGRGSVRTGLASMCLVALLFATPVLSSTSSGSALNDTEVIAFFLAAVVFLGPVHRGGPCYLLAGLALGLALGTKYTALAPAGALLAVGWWVDPRSRWPARVRAAAVMGGAAIFTGAFWYLRDWVVTGNPLPELSLHLGPLVFHRLTLPIDKVIDRTVFQAITGSAAVRSSAVASLVKYESRLWPLLIAVPLVGLLLAVGRRQPRYLRVAAACALVAAVAYLDTPTTGAGEPGMPAALLVGINLRYVYPSLALGLVLLGCLGGLARRPVPVALCCLPVALLEIVPDQIRVPAQAYGAGVVVVGAAALGWLAAAQPALRRLVVTWAVVAALPLGYLADRYYSEHRFVSPASVIPYYTEFNFARDLRHTSIALVGTPTQYAFYGPDLSNKVNYLGRVGKHGAFRNITTCQAWREAVDAGHYQYVVAWPLFTPLAALGWTLNDRGARLVVRNGPLFIFRIVRPLNPASCPRQHGAATAPATMSPTGVSPPTAPSTG